MNTEIVMYTTTDGFNLYGAWYQQNKAAIALLMIHGYCSNFYRTPLRNIAEYLAPRGYACLVANTRGHDRLANTEGQQPAEGALVERISESPRDLLAGIEWLRERGYRRIILIGHSLGGLKSLHFAAHHAVNELAGLVSCSCPRWNVPAHAENSAVIERARRMRAEGHEYRLMYDDSGNELGSPVMLLDRLEHFSAFQPLNNARRISFPALYTAAGNEPDQFRQAAEELSRAGAGQARLHIIPGTDHVYTGHEIDLARWIEEWLTAIGQSEPQPDHS